MRTKTRNLNVRNVAVVIDFVAMKLLSPLLFFPVELKKRLQKSEEKGDTAEEAKLCNAIGEKYSQEGMQH